MVRQGDQHQLRLHSIEYWPLLRQDTLDPMGDIGIGVDQVADDLQHAPSPDDGPRDHLLAANAGNGRPEYPGAGEIGIEQVGLFHLDFLHSNMFTYVWVHPASDTTVNWMVRRTRN